MARLENLKKTDFENLETQAFEIVSAPEPCKLSLIEVSDLSSSVRDGGGFSLLFQGPPAPILDQATYRVSQPSLGETDIFLVPVAETEAGIHYEAVFT